MFGNVDLGYTDEQPAEEAAVRGTRLEVIELPEAMRGSVLSFRRWAAERSFA